MARRDAPTLSDVAEKAGVGTAAVSAALNGKSSGTRVSDATRQRILQAAAELRYRPNAVAQSLRRRRTNTIGFYSGDRYADVSNPFISQVISGMQLGCREHGKDLLLHGDQVIANQQMDRRLPRLNALRSVEEVHASLTNGKIDGLILYVEPQDPLISLLADSSLPVIAVADVVAAFPSVVVDDLTGGRLQAQYLAEKGHRRVLYHTRQEERSSVKRRFAAFQEAAEALGMAVLPCITTGGASVLGESEEALLFSGPAEERHTAVACWADMSAYRLVNRLAAKGRQIPEEVAVIGYDGLVFPIDIPWRVTSIRVPWREVAHTAVSLLVDRIEGKEVPQETVLPVELVKGNTT